jgi:hypothetical protein
MAEFKAIETQEEFDKAIQARISRERETVKKELLEEISGLKKAEEELKKQVEGLVQEKEEKDRILEDYKNKISGYESRALQAKIAREVGLPYEMAERIRGKDEKTMKEDAEKLVELIKGSSPKTTPLKSTEPSRIGPKTEDDSYREMLKSINKD